MLYDSTSSIIPIAWEACPSDMNAIVRPVSIHTRGLLKRRSNDRLVPDWGPSEGLKLVQHCVDAGIVANNRSNVVFLIPQFEGERMQLLAF